MLTVSIIRGDSWKELQLQFPVQNAEMKKLYEELADLDTENVRTCIVGVNSEIKSLNDALSGKELGSSSLKELDFLSRRLNGLYDWELDVFNAALKLEGPKTLIEIVNLSCNLDKYKLVSSVTNKQELKAYLFDQRRNRQKDVSILDGRIVESYPKDYPGEITDSGYVSIEDRAVASIYDGRKLPEPYCDTNGIITARTYAYHKQVMLTFTLPATRKRLNAVLDELGVENFDDCNIYYDSAVQGLLERIPNYDGLEYLNLVFSRLSDFENRDVLFMAVMEAEVPASMHEVLQIVDKLDEYYLLEEIHQPADYARYVYGESNKFYVDSFSADFIDYDAIGMAFMKKFGAMATSFGFVERDYLPIHQLPQELTVLRLFSPLTAQVYLQNGGGNLKEEFNSMSAYELTIYQDEILTIIERENRNIEGDRGLAQYLDNVLLGYKIHSMNPTVEEWGGKLWGVLEVQMHGELSKGELQALTEEWVGQCRDGWGEGFRQQNIEIDRGELNVNFWNSGEDFSILPEQELKSQQEQHPGMQMGDL